MNIVAIESATETVGLAVATSGGAQASFTLKGRRRHVETLAPAMEHLFGQVGLSVSELDLVAVDLGPGLFTGLRVGIAAANVLAQSLGIGVTGFSSLDILTEAAAQRGQRGHLLVAIDARRGEVFATVRSLKAGAGQADDVVAPGLFAPVELADRLRHLGGVSIVGIGDGAQRYCEVFDAVSGVSCLMDALASPPPLTLLAMAAQRHTMGTAPAPHSVLPLYMREADAKSNFTQVATN